MDLPLVDIFSHALSTDIQRGYYDFTARLKILFFIWLTTVTFTELLYGRLCAVPLYTIR